MAANPICVSNAIYTYTHDDNGGPDEAIDAHHVTLRSTKAKTFLLYLSALSLPSAALSLSLLKGESIHIPLWSLLISALFVRLFMQKNVQKESIIIMQAFGVQLETQYKSGRKVHWFFPIDKILKPVLTECVTPVTCYWSLSLIVHGEEELVLVFKGMRPPLKMLIPIWKALCAATNRPRTVDEFR